MNRVELNYSSPAVQAVRYDKFRGVDFSTDPSLVAQSRSPYAPNMISDSGGQPEKRLGWRKLQSVEAPVNGLYYGVIGQNTVFLAHGGTKLYSWTESSAPAVLRTGLTNAPSSMFAMGGKLWILTGGEYLCYDGEAVTDVSASAYVPITVIARAPSGGGTVYEDVNLVTPRRKNYFKADGTAKVYQLDATGIESAAVEAVVNGTSMTEGSGFTVNRTTGQVTFTEAPSAPAVAGQDNVFITFSKTVSGYADRIQGCTICATYGVGTSDRVFVSGNPNYRNWDWYSGLGDPSYFPDLGYNQVGTEATAIMGYTRLGSYLAVVKEDNGQDSTVFLRSAQLIDGKPAFPLERAVSGVGAISKRSFATLLDEPLLLGGTGVFALTSNLITADRTLQSRSGFVDAQLTKEDGLTEASAVEWKGYYLLAVNSRCYILDGRQPKVRNSEGKYAYECYYWENIPAVCWMNYRREDQQTLYFGTADGRICRLNDDMGIIDRYADYPDGLTGGADAIHAAWATKMDDDGNPGVLKTMLIKGCCVTMKPYQRSSAKVCIRTDRDAMDWQVRYQPIDIFTFEDIDFSRFTFNANDGPQEIFLRKKVKKYKRIQIIIKNDAAKEGFGVYGISKFFYTAGYAKK